MNFSRSGALDLAGLGRTPPQAAPVSSGGRFAFDADERNFQQLTVDASMRHLVVLSLWTPRSPQSIEFNDLLAGVIEARDGQATLVRVDVDSQPAVAQAIGAQSVPLVIAMIAGTPVMMFQSTADEAEVGSMLDQMLQLAVQNGVTGRAEAGAAPQEEPFADPRFVDAEAALAANDLDEAIAEYERLAANQPGDAGIKERLAGVQLLRRTRSVDLHQARSAAAADATDVDAQLLVADLDVSGGHADDAFSRLIDLIKVTSGDERERVRLRLLELFTVVGVDDPRVATARRGLATALF